MTFFFVRLGLCLSLLVAPAIAQEKPATPPAAEKPATGDSAKPAEREMPPELKAFNEANKITDPAGKIEALEKVKKDFPDTGAAGMADSAIFNTLTSKMPGDTARIRRTARAMYKAAEAKDKKDAAEQHTPAVYNRRGAAAQTHRLRNTTSHTCVGADVRRRSPPVTPKKRLLTSALTDSVFIGSRIYRRRDPLQETARE